MKNTNTITDDTNMVLEDFDTVEILSDHAFIDLKILSGTISRKEIEQYERDLEEYQTQLEEFERMGFGDKAKKPIEPKYKTEYKTYTMNLSDKIISGFSEDWDKERDCPVLIMEYYTRDGQERNQYNINITKKEFMDILRQFGATFFQSQPVK